MTKTITVISVAFATLLLGIVIGMIIVTFGDRLFKKRHAFEAQAHEALRKCVKKSNKTTENQQQLRPIEEIVADICTVSKELSFYKQHKAELEKNPYASREQINNYDTYIKTARQQLYKLMNEPPRPVGE